MDLDDSPGQVNDQVEFADDDRIMDSITAPETPATEGQDVVDDDHGATVEREPLTDQHMDPEDGEPQAVCIPSELRAESVSSTYGCYVTLDGVALEGDLDVGATSCLLAPVGDKLGFTWHITLYSHQYAMAVIQVTAEGAPSMKHEPIATITIKAVSISSCGHTSYCGRDEVSTELKTFCGSINSAARVPDEIVKLEMACTKINISVHDQVLAFLQEDHPAIATKLKQVRDQITSSTQMKIGVVFHAGSSAIDYIKGQCTILEDVAGWTKNKSHDNYPLRDFFRKSPGVHQQLHIGNAPMPLTDDFPDIDTMFPAVDAYDTPEERLVPLVMGALCDYRAEVGNQQTLEKMEFAAAAMEILHFDERRFLLLVESPNEEDVYQPQEGESCLIRLNNVARVASPAAPVSTDTATHDDIAEQIFQASVKARREQDPDTFIRDMCLQLIKSELVTPEIIAQVKRIQGEMPNAWKNRIKGLVGSLAEVDGIIATTDEELSATPENKCEWWSARRVAIPVAGSPEGYTAYIVTIPLVPKSEALEDGSRPIINVTFPMLKWERNANLTDRGFFERRIKEHFADQSMKLTVVFRQKVSDKTIKAALSAINDLHHPRSADKEVAVSEESVRKYHYLLDFKNGKSGNVFETYPHMAYLWTKPDQVPEHLTELWQSLDKTKQDAYFKLNSLDEGMMWVVGVAGSGKTTFLQFIILMAKFGDKEKEHDVKVLYFVNHNAAVNEFADGMNQACAKLGKKGLVIRLHSFESEVGNLLDMQTSNKRPKDLFDIDQAEAACLGNENQFLVHHQLSQFALDVNNAHARVRKTRLPALVLSQAAYVYFNEHPDKFGELRQALADLTGDKPRVDDAAEKKQGLIAEFKVDVQTCMDEIDETDEPVKDDDGIVEDKLTKVKRLIAELIATYLESFSGVVCATPHTGCHSKFVRHYKSNICLMDDAAKVGELDLLQVVRKHNPTVMVIVGDPQQLGPWVRQSHGDVISNPWQETMTRSTLDRAIRVGGVVQANLTLNHRGMAGLPMLCSDSIYHHSMEPAVMGPEAWPAETRAWHGFLVELCPTLHGSGQRVLVEIQGASTEKLGKSTYNMSNVLYATDVAVAAAKDDKLTGLGGRRKSILIITFYKAQAHFYLATLDKKVTNGQLSRKHRQMISVSTVDAAQGAAADFVISDMVKNMSPGFIADKRRLCVALTRARQAELIMMSRGVFVGHKIPHHEMPTGHDVGVVANIYQDVSDTDGIVTIPSVVAASEDASDGFCENCRCPGHRQKECSKLLQCQNCERRGHDAKHCSLPPILRCRNCRSPHHTEDECNTCRICRVEGHDRKDCPKQIKCRNCQEMGHKAFECPRR